MGKFKEGIIKCIKDCFIVFWLSIFAMILISSIEARTSPQLLDKDFVYVQEIYEFSVQDTTKKVVKTKELTKKEQEFKDYQIRQTKLEYNMKKMEQQSILLDSLLKKDTLN